MHSIVPLRNRSCLTRIRRYIRVLCSSYWAALHSRSGISLQRNLIAWRSRTNPAVAGPYGVWSKRSTVWGKKRTRQRCWQSFAASGVGMS